MESARDGLGDPAIVMCQVVRPKPERHEDLGIGTVENAGREIRRECHLDDSERTALLPEVRRVEHRAPEGCECLADGVLWSIGQIPDRRMVVKIEAASGLARDQVRCRKRCVRSRISVPGETPPPSASVCAMGRHRAAASARGSGEGARACGLHRPHHRRHIACRQHVERPAVTQMGIVPPEPPRDCLRLVHHKERRHDRR